VTVEKEQVRVNMVLSVHQNMTDLPNQTSTLTATPDSDIYSSFTDAVRKLDPSTRISDLTLRVNSTRAWLNLTAAMNVTGVTHTSGDLSVVNMTWRAFNMSADLRTGNLSYNAIGKKYLRPVVDFYVNASMYEADPNATIKAVTFFVNGTQSVAGADAANHVGNTTVFDFRSLGVPLERWTRTYSVSNNTTTWRFAPGSVLAAFVRAQKLNQTFEIFSDYSYSAEISVLGLARASGNSLLIDLGTGEKEWIMSGVVVLAIVLAMAAQILFRMKRKAARLGRR